VNDDMNEMKMKVKMKADKLINSQLFHVLVSKKSGILEREYKLSIER
jgi:hypothetical protein